MSFTDFLNLTINENDRLQVSDSDSNSSIHSNSDIADDSIIFNDEVKDFKEQKGKNKRKKQLDNSITLKAKRQRLEMPLRNLSRVFLKTESFQLPEFLLWLKTNQHLRTIKGGVSKICELLDKVRMENPGLDELFLAFAENGEKVNPYFFDIKRLKRENDSIIYPPEWNKWNEPTASTVTYIWSFDIPIENITDYCKEIEENIRKVPHNDPNRADYHPAFVAQFRNYLINELPLRKDVTVFHWLYVGQTEQTPPARRWRHYYGRHQRNQPTLNFPMHTLVKREIPHRLVVVSSDGSKDMEAIVAAVLNICVDFGGIKSNAINRGVCGQKNQAFHKMQDKHVTAIEKYNPELEIIICVYCRRELSIRSTHRHYLNLHVCSSFRAKRKIKKGNMIIESSVSVYSRLYTQMNWCPRKDTCQACAIIVPRPEDDTSKDLPLEEILLKSPEWKRKRQDLLMNTFDNKTHKILCMHCFKEVMKLKGRGVLEYNLWHGCSAKNARSEETGRMLLVSSNLFYVYDWCTDKTNCKSCIQIVDRKAYLTPEEKHRNAMLSFDFNRQKIICVHCDKELTRLTGKSTQLTHHRCLTKGVIVPSKLFQKTRWCTEEACTECLRIKDRNN